MTREEIEKAIENDEIVWYSSSDKVVKIDLSKKNKYDIQEYSIFNDNYIITALVINYTLHYLLKYLFKTQAEAEHYLHHANVTRTETLPFLTWEEFLKEMRLNFIACDGVSNMILYCCNNTIYLVDEEYPEFNTTSWELTEQNFYKAYDECVRLFRREE